MIIDQYYDANMMQESYRVIFIHRCPLVKESKTNLAYNGVPVKKSPCTKSIKISQNLPTHLDCYFKHTKNGNHKKNVKAFCRP